MEAIKLFAKVRAYVSNPERFFVKLGFFACLGLFLGVSELRTLVSPPTSDIRHG
jgi:hypothetical protein